MVRNGEVFAHRVLKIVELFVVGDVVDAVGGEVAADIGGASALAAAAEGIFQAVHDFVIAEGGGRIVEVAAENHRIGTLADVLLDDLRLLLPQHVRHGNLFRQF